MDQQNDTCFLCILPIENQTPSNLENIISCDCKIFIHHSCFQDYISQFNTCPYCKKPITYFKYIQSQELPIIITIQNNNNQNNNNQNQSPFIIRRNHHINIQHNHSFIKYFLIFFIIIIIFIIIILLSQKKI